jgi:triacylglycerol lipase
MNVRDRIEEVVGGAQYHALTRGVARVIGFHSDSARVDGTKIPFLVRGWGVPIVLVHGFAGDKEGWLLLARYLRHRSMVLIPDLPGFGDAGVIPPEHASAKHQAAALAGLFDHLGLGRVHLVGSSMGGGIVQRFAQDYPARASSMTLVGSVGPYIEKSEVGKALDRGENPLVVDDVESHDDLIALITEKKPMSTRAIRRYLAGRRVARREVESALFRGFSEAPEGEGIPRNLEAIRTPALVVHGACDRVIHPATGRALAQRLPDARLHMMQGVGHVPQLEAPAALARAIDVFIGEVEERRLRPPPVEAVRRAG